MSWYSDFRSKLDSIGANASMTRGQSAFDIAYSLSKVKGTGPTGTLASKVEDDTPWYMVPLKAAGDIMGAINDNTVGHKILEGLDAPGNAVRSIWAEALKQENQTDNPSTNLNYDWGKLGDSLVKGFFHEGDQKYTSGSDIEKLYAERNAAGKGDMVSGILGIGDNVPGEADSSDWQRALQGFAVEVAADPLTFISGGAIRKTAQVTGISKGVTKSLQKVGLDKSAVKNAAQELETSGTATKVEPKTADELLKAYNAKPSNPLVTNTADVVDEAHPIQPELDLGLPPATPVVREGLPEAPAATQAAPMPGQGAFDFGLNARSGFASDLVHADLQAQSANLESALRGVVGNRYRVKPEEIPSLFQKGMTPETTRVIEEAIPARSVKESAILHTVQRLIIQDAERGGRKYGIVLDPDTGEILHKGKGLSEEEFRQYIQNVAAKGPWQKDRISIYTPDGEIARAAGSKPGVDAGEYTQRLIDGNPIASRELTIPKGDEFVPLTDYMKSRTDKWKDAEIFGGKPAVTETIPGQEVMSRLVGKPRTEWGNTMKNLGFTDEDVKYISAGRTQSAVESRIKKVLGTQARFDFPSVKQLEEAYRLGHISKDKYESILSQFGGAKTAKGAATYQAKLADRVAKMGERVAKNSKATTKVDKADEAVAAATAQKAAVVEPATKIVEDIKNGTKDSTILDGAPIGDLDKMEKDSIVSALQRLAKESITVPKGWKDTTATGAKANGKNAVFLKGNNVFNQYTLHRGIVNTPAMRRAVSTNNPEQVYSTYMRLLSGAEYVMKKQGMEPILGRGASGIPLSLHDVLGSLPKEFVLDNFIKYDAKASKQLAPSLMFEAAHVAARFAADDLTTGDAINQLLTILKTSKIQTSTGKTFTSGYASTLSTKEAQKAAVRMFLDAGPAIQQRIQVNLARNAVTEGNQIRALSDEVINNFERLMQQPHNFNGTDILRLASDSAITGAVKDGAKKMGASDNVERVVTDEALAAVAEILPKASLDVINKGIKAMKPTITQTTEEAANLRAKTAVDMLDSQIDELADLPTYDVSERLQMSSMARIVRGFAPHIANEDLHKYFVSQFVHANQVAYAKARVLNGLAKTYTKPQIVEAYNFLRMDKDVATLPEGPLKDAVTDVGNVMSWIFDNGDTGVMVRNGITPEHVSKHMAHVGLSKYELKDLTSWKSWETDNPLDTFSRMFTAVMRAHAEVQLGAQISKVFGKSSPAGLEKAVRISDSRGVSRLATVIDRSLVYDEEIARQIHVLGDMLESVSAAPKGGMGHKILRTYDGAMHAYKSGLTIYRPGHHIRNQLGDMWLSAMAGVTDPRYYRDAASILRVNKSIYSDWDPDLTFRAQPGKEKFTFKFQGKEQKVSAETMYDLMYRNGGLPEYATIEDIGSHMAQEEVQSAAGKLRERVRAPFGGRVHKAAAAVSESRDHYMRAAHFLYEMERAPLKGKTFEEALQNAAQEAVAKVRKWHPDGSDLGAAEKAAMRRLIPFYSWVRKAIPLVLETMVMKPGAFLAYPRGMYAWAQANGVDLQSMAEPFPLDQLFPSWLSESTQGPQFGEQGSYAGLRPGLPGPDILDQYLAGPGKALQTTMGSLTPAIRVPVELAGGHKLQSGAPVGNVADYLLQQLPMGATGGSLLGDPLAQQSPSNANYDTSYMGGAKGVTAFNWLTGLGLTDMSKPSYIKSARYEARNAG